MTSSREWCPQCGWSPREEAEKQAASTTKRGFEWQTWGFAAVFVLVLIGGLAKANEGGNGSNGGDAVENQLICKELVRQSLKNPSTAKFSNTKESSWEASGTVVAENSLGGKQTAEYRCEVSGGSVRLVSFEPRT